MTGSRERTAPRPIPKVNLDAFPFIPWNERGRALRPFRVLISRRDGRYFVADRDGRRIGAPMHSCRSAEERVQGLEAALTNRPQRRNCISCGRAFDSAHKFNRICPSCSQLARSSLI